MSIAQRALLLAVLSPACVPLDDEPPPPPPPAERTTFAFEPIEVDMPPRWGAAIAGPLVVGGVDEGGTVTTDVWRIDGRDTDVNATPVATMASTRFCNCALFDEGRQQMLAIGGRNGDYVEEPSVELIDLETDVSTPITPNGAVDRPVGCHAFFVPSVDRGYVFGGANMQGFGKDTFRWDPEAQTFTLLDIEAPPQRYDAGIVELHDGSIVMLSGMGRVESGIKMLQDIWRFDPTTESWSEIVATNTPPRGRRYPFTALAPDDSLVVFGYGSDSGRGESVLGDLWTFTFATGEWAPLELDGEAPAPRGFAYRWPGPADSAGVLAFGTNADLATFGDAFALRVPDALVGDWR